jgi:hypothetical protein
MRGFVLQDWLTIRGATGVTQIVQNEGGWLSLEMYQDAIFWLQISELTLSSGTVKMNYDTAPIKDETLFSPMGISPITTGLTLTTTAMPAPLVTPVILSAIAVSGNGVTPLSRWVRWRLTQSGAITNPWDITFRVLVSCNQLFAPGMGAGGGGLGGYGGWSPGQR